MKRSIRKAAILLLSALLLLTGCNGTGEVKEADNIRQEELVDTQTKEITFAFRYMKVLVPSVPKEVFKDIELVTSSSWKFKLSFTQYLNRVFSWGRIPNPIKFSGTEQKIENGDFDAVETGGSFYYLASKGLIMDLTNLFPQYAPNYFKMLSESDLESVTYNGRIMGIPAHWPGRSRYCVVARKSLVDKYNIKSLSNFQELEDFLRIVKKNEPDYVPMFYPGDEKKWYEILGYVSPNDISRIVYKVGDPEMKLIPWEETPEFVEIMNMLKRWREEGYIVNSDGGLSSNIRNFASYIEKVDHIALLEDFYGYGSGPDWCIFPLYPERPSVLTPDTEKILVIPKNSPNAINVLKFVEWVHSEQANYDMFMYGIEGRNYTVDEKSGKLRKKTGADYEGNICFTNMKYVRQFVTNPQNLLEFYREVSKLEEIPCPHAGFYMDENLLPMEIWHKRAGLCKEMLDSLYDVDIDEFRQQLRDVGTYELVRVMQQELDKWRESRESN